MDKKAHILFLTLVGILLFSSLTANAGFFDFVKKAAKVVAADMVDRTVTKYGGAATKEYDRQARENNRQTSAELINDVIGLSEAHEKSKQWHNSNKYDKQDMVISAVTEFTAETTGQDMVSSLGALAKAGNNYNRNKSNDDPQALGKAAVDIMNVVWDAHDKGKEKKREYAAQKCDIIKHLEEMGNNYDKSTAVEIAGQILSIQKRNDMTEEQKREMLSFYGFYGNEDRILEEAAIINKMDEGTASSLIIPSPSSPINPSNPLDENKTADNLAKQDKNNALETITAIKINAYDLDIVKLNEDQKSKLDEVYIILDEYPELNLEVIGHTCSVGKNSINERIGLKRAEEVKNYLIQKGIPSERISSSSKGESDPLTDNKTEESRKLNRRITFVVYE